MSYIACDRQKSQDMFKKSQFYVEFLGWMECRGVRGHRYTDQVIRELQRRQKSMESPPKLTVQVSKKNVKISQEVPEVNKKGIKKVKFPPIPAKDVTFVHQPPRPGGGGGPGDIVACIYLGYMPRTQRYVHVHVYRFDQVSTASMFASHVDSLVEANADHIRAVESDLASRREIDDPKLTPLDNLGGFISNDSAIGSTSSAFDDDDDDEFQSFRDNKIDADLQSLKDVQPFDSVTDELKHRLKIVETPLLLPPKDYDTISRAHGNLEQINKRRCLNQHIVGEYALPRDQDSANESGVDLSFSGHDEAEAVTKYSDSEDRSFMSKLKLLEDRISPSVTPKQQHKPLPSKDTKQSPQVPHKPTMGYEPKNSPRVSPKPVLNADMRNAGSSHSGQKLPEVLHPGSDFVYPPRSPNSPKVGQNSPRIGHHPLNLRSRQNSENSVNSEGSRSGVDEGRAGTPIHHYRVGSNDDLYALPVKGHAMPQKGKLPDLPPDYQDDDVELRGRRKGSGKNYYSFPVDIRSEAAGVRNSRPNSAELNAGRRTNSPNFMRGPQQHGHEGMHSPRIQRNVQAKR